QCDYFWFVDPTFTLRERFAATLCKELKEQCPGIKWYCETRADCSAGLLESMAGAGCISIDVALESGSPRVLKTIQKDLDPQKLIPFTAKCKQLGIRVLVFVMYGLPGETYADFRETMKILKKIKQDIYTISYSQTLVLPGTRLEMQAKEEKILPGHFSWYDPSFEEIPRWAPSMSGREIDKIKRLLFKYQFLLHNSRFSYLKKLPKLLALTYWQRNDKIKHIITRFPIVHRFVKTMGRVILGKESL
ncbi:MAG TPA: radical SAM protein, partial [Candidatus Deferrimicrobium sp.]|nr:radical SAM protein [Candidatus Deferrimicrobium sp.]